MKQTLTAFTESAFAPGALPSRHTQRFHSAKSIAGFFNYTDMTHFSLILELQAMWGVGGDILEIGTYWGRSASLLYPHLRRDERLVLCDSFERDTNDSYPRRPSPADLVASIASVNSRFDERRLEVHSCYSTNLRFDSERTFRFVHIDGGHDMPTCLSDLRLAANHLARRGVIAVDDYAHGGWPGVSSAVDGFLEERSDICVALDFNRYGAGLLRRRFTKTGLQVR